MAKERPDLPHPRARVSGRMSASDFRALMGRSAKGRKGFRPTLKRVIGKTDGEPCTEPLEFVLPFVPPSVNSIYISVSDNKTGKPKRVLSTKARKARKAIQTFIRGQLDAGEIYELHIDVELPSVTKAGHLRKVDLTNRVKFLEDSIASALGIDDRQFFRVVLTKFHAEHERTVIRVLPFGYTARDAA